MTLKIKVALNSYTAKKNILNDYDYYSNSNLSLNSVSYSKNIKSICYEIYKVLFIT